ncbi:MAG: flavin reductase family protein [Bacteroidales bacterium]|mgnify:CR=1 FL=1|jgi:flavin reductase (DIM6/NTAB) family NADH-FMN oxidoreductase RutF|nr:flavin reductase family protein [Bacteroidales bacterium]MDD4702713.1 flavin reductase family protein [Bacteroidales bacterium]MDX9797265.1 flavin reductase family protein [Bacteroidales bacterium]
MSKVSFKPGTMIYPLPAVMVSCGETPEEYNIVTIGWVGTICSEPPMCYISVRKSRLSHEIISRTKAFVINLTTKDLAKVTDWCGVKSGRDFNKFEETKLTPIKAEKVNAPMILESPLNIECEVVEIKELGSHDMFISKVVNINADKKLINPKTNSFELEKANLLTYSHGKYYTIGEKLGFFGYSIQRRRKKK